MSFIVDKAVALAWCFEGEQTAGVMALLDRGVAEGALAPQLWSHQPVRVSGQLAL